jgi:hypothetical protein
MAEAADGGSGAGAAKGLVELEPEEDIGTDGRGQRKRESDRRVS